MKPYIVLGTYKWGKKGRYAHKMGKALCAKTAELGFVPFPDIGGKNNVKAAWSDDALHAEVRMTAMAGSEGTDWHQDGDTTGQADMDHGLIVWANKAPTQFKIKEPSGVNNLYQPKPFEVVYFRNLDGMHRRPPNAPKRRWHFRQRVKVVGDYEIVWAGEN